MPTIQDLKQKIESKNHKIAVIGLGYVGLPLAATICRNYIHVLGLDVDQSKIDKLNQGNSYIDGVNGDDVLKYIENGLFQPSTDFSLLEEADAILICVPTPLDENNDPDLSYVENTTKEIAKYLNDGQLIILESTTYPGTVESVMKPVLDKASEGYFLAYSPEREDPGNKNFATSSTPKIVAADETNVLETTVLLYSQFIQTIVPVPSIKVGEAAKITENIFRSVNIALVNELKLIFDKMDIDVWDVIDAAKTKPFGYMPFYPGPGIGGHCIPIDPYYLSWKAKEVGQKTRFIELAGEINLSMTDFIFEKLQEGLNLQNHADIKNKKILILGVAYKKNVADQRESPAFPLMKLLKNHGADISFHDPFIPNILPSRHFEELTGLASEDLSVEIIKGFDAAVLVTDHDNVDYSMLADNIPLIIDTRNLYESRNISGKARIVKA